MNPFDPFGYWKTLSDVTRTAIDSQSVIMMRTLGMAGLWNSSSNENHMMIREKQAAAIKSATNVALAIGQGKSPAEITQSAIKPYKQKTRANSKRLQKRGLR